MRLLVILPLNDTLTRMLAEKAPEELIRARALKLDLLYAFVADARTKIAVGLTTAEEIDRVLPLYLARTH